jgi:nucleotide-binding universal stress UspA family protein
MSQLNSLLVAVDFKKSSEELCHQACFMARQISAEVTLLYVMEGSPLNPYYQDNITSPLDDWIQKTVIKLDEVKARFNKEGIKVNEHIIKEGVAYKAICKTADEINACGIVLGVGDHYFLEDFIGTTADKVTRMANQPVIIINHESHKDGLKKILCAYDFSENSEKALESAIVIARDMEAHLDVVHVIHDNYADYYMSPFQPSYDVSTNHETEIKSLKAKVRTLIESKIDALHCPGVSFKISIGHGIATSEITRMVKEYNSDLLLIGANGHNAFMKFFLGSVTEKILKRAPCSIMVCKKEHIEEST